MTLGARDTQVVELMDDPACDPRRLSATLRRFDVMNRLVAGWGTVYRAHLRPYLRALGRPARVLDIGSGGGDVLARLARHAERDGLEVDWLGIDPDPRAHAVAVTRQHPRVTYRCAATTQLRAEGAEFDAVLSNHVLHHLGADELRAFVSDSLALSTGPVLHGDIARGRLAYSLYAIGVTPFAPGTFLRTDGLRSIRRSYRAGELADALHGLGRWTVSTPVPFRLLAVGTPGAGASAAASSAAGASAVGAPDSPAS